MAIYENLIRTLRHRRRAFVNQALGLVRLASIANADNMEYDDLDTYNGDTILDMYVDNDYQINTSELGYVDEDIDDYIDNLNNWD